MDSSQLFSTISDAFLRVKDDLNWALNWAPDWAIGPALILVALMAAFAVHSLAIAIIRRLITKRRVFLSLLLSRTMGPIRLGLIIFAVAAAVQTGPFSPPARDALHQVLLIAFVLLLGWISL